MKPKPTSNYPEHDKLKAIKRESQACGKFIEWLERKGIHLARIHNHGPDCRKRCEFFDGQLYMAVEPMPKLLAEHFGIDPVKLDDEKRDMLERLRGQAP